MKNTKGFTLIELLVVIAIIGLLLTLAVIALGTQRAKTRDQRRIIDLRNIQTGLELHFTDFNKYPVVEKATTLGTAGALCLDANGFGNSCTSAFLDEIPADPGSSSYIYTSPSPDGSSYVIRGALENDAGNLRAGSIEVTPSGFTNVGK